MKLNEYKHWLDGYMDGKDRLNEEQYRVVRDELDKVEDTLTTLPVYQPIPYYQPVYIEPAQPWNPYPITCGDESPFMTQYTWTPHTFGTLTDTLSNEQRN